MGSRPPTPDQSGAEWVKTVRIAREKRLALKEKIRAITSPVVVRPSFGRGTLVGIECTTVGEVERLCIACEFCHWVRYPQFWKVLIISSAMCNSRIPRGVDLQSLHHARLDLFKSRLQRLGKAFDSRRTCDQSGSGCLGNESKELQMLAAQQ